MLKNKKVKKNGFHNINVYICVILNSYQFYDGYEWNCGVYVDLKTF